MQRQTLGVLHVENRFPIEPGHLLHRASCALPLEHECLTGITPRDIVEAPLQAEAAIVAAARRLQQRGVAAVIGCCGSFANFQSALTAAVHVPVFSSVLIQVPLLQRGLPSGRRLGLVFASAASFTPRVRQECGILDTASLAVCEVRELPAFEPILANRPELDGGALATQLRELIRTFLGVNRDVGGLVLQCSELAPYGDLLRAEFARPVFDVNTLARWVLAGAGMEAHPGGFRRKGPPGLPGAAPGP